MFIRTSDIEILLQAEAGAIVDLSDTALLELAENVRHHLDYCIITGIPSGLFPSSHEDFLFAEKMDKFIDELQQRASPSDAQDLRNTEHDALDVLF